MRLEISRADIDRVDQGETVVLIDREEGTAVELWPAWKDYTGPTLVKEE